MNGRMLGCQRRRGGLGEVNNVLSQPGFDLLLFQHCTQVAKPTAVRVDGVLHVERRAWGTEWELTYSESSEPHGLSSY